MASVEKGENGWGKFTVYLPPELTARVLSDAEEDDRDHSEMIRRLVKLCYRFQDEEEEIKNLKEQRKKSATRHVSFRDNVPVQQSQRDAAE